jgi:hypothetical protein
MQALTAIQIITLLKRIPSTKKVFKGICARNVTTRPPQKIKTLPSAYIHNTGYLLEGIHWVLIIYAENCTFFIDTFGRPPKSVFLEASVKRSFTPVLYNTKPLQSRRSQVCGHYCIYFLVHLLQNRSITEINKKFTKNHRKNDSLVFNFVKKLGKKWQVSIL